MSTETPLDPAFFANRACNGMPTNTFFPAPYDLATLDRARATCASCPVLRQCASWAAPLVENRLITEAVVAGVLTPALAGKRYAAARAAAVEELAAIAAGDVHSSDLGGAAWTAA
ncbi:WhiB family transcriptional regulator (plasmid) [Nocardia sp. PE-7]|uniref:WhiB family transcriptional regulator n=1 Tax=Nocardia sp. PE-7 TaxID=3058426 RepID=UPI002658E7AC|nr:WhiB family transcriptional regulator [Nocardia sp. PE-7]WKG13582.1 WhiB family transcriptional regulator [Nocardia sp. PE-7]